jgi:hypothetical protein
MSRRITVIGLAALCALALSAIAASGASAAGATAFTCIEGGGAHNTNSHCVPGSSGNFGHVAIAEGENTQLTLNAIEGVKTILKGEVAANPLELKATGIECNNCMAENKTVGGTMEVTGTGGQIMYTNVLITSGGALETNCEVFNHTVTTEPLKFTTTTATGATIEPVAANRILAKIHFVSKAGKTCSINGAEVPVKGTVPGTVSGATLKVNVAEGTTLEIGEGEPASLTGEATMEAGLTEGVHHAVSVTAT